MDPKDPEARIQAFLASIIEGLAKAKMLGVNPAPLLDALITCDEEIWSWLDGADEDES